MDTRFLLDFHVVCSWLAQADAFGEFYKAEIHAEPDAGAVSAIGDSRLFKCQKLNI